MNKTYHSVNRIYTAPRIERIELDTLIALQLESTPPEAPGEAYLNPPGFFNNDPFKSNLGQNINPQEIEDLLFFKNINIDI